MLKSKLLIGEFVILSQNYSHSEIQNALLGERIVKLVSFWASLSEPTSGQQVTAQDAQLATSVICERSSLTSQHLTLEK